MDQVNQRCSHAFTLVEILAVITIMLVLMALSRPAFNLLAVGTDVSRAGQIIGDQMAVARQEAVAKNRDVQVRFYNVETNGASGWKAVQVWRVEQTVNGPTNIPVGKIAMIPQNIMITTNSTLSPLLYADTSISGTTNVPPYGNISYHGFRYRSNGSTDTFITDTNNFLTLQSVTASGNPPSNYYTVQVNPITGKISIFRP